MRNITVATTSRSDYGILYPLLREIDNDKELNAGNSDGNSLSHPNAKTPKIVIRMPAIGPKQVKCCVYTGFLHFF